MNKPKYRLGDRINNWTIVECYYSLVHQVWVYRLKFNSRQLTCSEVTLDSIKLHS